MDRIVGEAAGGGVHIVLRSAPPLALHGRDLARTDGNSPALVQDDGAIVYFSHYVPVGHTYRKRGRRSLDFDQPAIPIRFVGDSAPATGKWLEAVWARPDGGYLGLYHAEELAHCPRRLYVPYIGLARSEDGIDWHLGEPVLRPPAGQIDCSYRNGFFAGGYGDLCALADRRRARVYVAFTSFVADESAQGIVMARFAEADPSGSLEWWQEGKWRLAGEGLPQPLWPMRRGWRHLDPDGYWGPAIHYNRQLDAYVMLLNHTAGGFGNLLQEGVYFSVNRDLARPDDWSEPAKLVDGGAWYPQVIGLEAGDGDARAGAVARFYMAGYSAWTVEFFPLSSVLPQGRPLKPTKPQFRALFGSQHKSPW